LQSRNRIKSEELKPYYCVCFISINVICRNNNKGSEEACSASASHHQ